MCPGKRRLNWVWYVGVGEADLPVQVIEPDRLEIVEPGDRQPAPDRAEAHRSRSQMTAGGMAGDVDAGRIGVAVAETFGEPGDRMADLADNLVHARVGRQGVSDDRDIDAVRQRSLGEKGVPLLVVPLPVAAVDEHSTSCFRTFGKTTLSLASTQAQNAFTRSASLTARSYPALSAGSISAGETKFT
jgi:hypothetical protein